jgi:hypothetical protein
MREDGKPFVDVPKDNPPVEYYRSPAAAVEFERSAGLRFANNVLSQLGGAGIRVDQFSSNIEIDSNEIADVSSSGMIVGSPNVNFENFDLATLRPADVDITNNRVSNVGVEYKGAVGIQVLKTSRVNISRNLVEDAPYSGISVGSDQRCQQYSTLDRGGQPVHLTGRHLVSKNLVRNTMREKRDGGGVYIQGDNAFSTVEGNVVLDMKNDYGAGLYSLNSIQKPRRHVGEFPRHQMGRRKEGRHAQRRQGAGQQHRGFPDLRSGHLRSDGPLAHLAELQEQALCRRHRDLVRPQLGRELHQLCDLARPGMTRNTVMDDAFWRGPMAIPFLKAQAWHEAGKQYPAPECGLDRGAEARDVAALEQTK